MNIIGNDLPTIYADMNLYRYVAYGEVEVADFESFKWVYSHVHLDEMARTGNTDALEGMRLLGAVEVCDVLDKNFASVGNVVLNGYVDPDERYRQHLEAVSGFEDSDSTSVEVLLRIFGADNFAELSLTPEMLREEVDRLTGDLEDGQRSSLLDQADSAAVEFQKTIDVHMSEMQPIDRTRLAMGINSGDRHKAEACESPIEEIWKIIEPAMGEVTLDQFFGFTPHPALAEIPHTQHGILGGAHIILNLLGISPDRGMAKRDKIRNIMSDSQHLGMASYCNALISSDKRFINKARAIYTYVKSKTNTLHIPYDPEGITVYIGTREAETGA